jgi:hypothetical protein
VDRGHKNTPRESRKNGKKTMGIQDESNPRRVAVHLTLEMVNGIWRHFVKEQFQISKCYSYFEQFMLLKTTN